MSTIKLPRLLNPPYTIRTRGQHCNDVIIARWLDSKKINETWEQKKNGSGRCKHTHTHRLSPLMPSLLIRAKKLANVPPRLYQTHAQPSLLYPCLFVRTFIASVRVRC